MSLEQLFEEILRETKEEYIENTKKPLTERDIQDVTFDKKLVIKQIKNEEDKNKFFEIFRKNSWTPAPEPHFHPVTLWHGEIAIIYVKNKIKGDFLW